MKPRAHAVAGDYLAGAADGGSGAAAARGRRRGRGGQGGRRATAAVSPRVCPGRSHEGLAPRRREVFARRRGRVRSAAGGRPQRCAAAPGCPGRRADRRPAIRPAGTRPRRSAARRRSEIAHAGGSPRVAAAGSVQPGAGQGPLARRRSARRRRCSGWTTTASCGPLVERPGDGGWPGRCWAARRRRTPRRFPSSLPPCPVNRLSLDLPLGLVPAVDQRHRGGFPSGRRGICAAGRSSWAATIAFTSASRRRTRPPSSSGVWPWRGSRWSTTFRSAAWKCPRS